MSKITTNDPHISIVFCPKNKKKQKTHIIVLTAPYCERSFQATVTRGEVQGSVLFEPIKGYSAEELLYAGVALRKYEHAIWYAIEVEEQLPPSEKNPGMPSPLNPFNPR
jgi:hypothetical protein